MLGAAMGDTIIVHGEGEGAEETLEKLVKRGECGFGEECG